MLKELPSSLTGFDKTCIPASCELLLLFVAFHPSRDEIDRLQSCLQQLPPRIGYAVVVNDYCPGEPVDRLAADAKLFLTVSSNDGYGRAVNRLVQKLANLPLYLGILNTDLSWSKGSLDVLLEWLKRHPDVSLGVPQILDEYGHAQQLCKRHPTVLG